MTKLVLPSTYPRRVLLALSGLSPQVVTETVYALAVQEQTPFIPTEIHLLCTGEGAERARLMLQDPQNGQLAQLCRDYHITQPIEFSAEHVHAFCDKSGNVLQDIRTPEHNACAAQTVMEWVKRLTADPQTAVYASISGGRNTISYYLGLAMSLFGRPQDRILHVLVSEDFEANHNFYYPPPQPEILFDRENQAINTADAQITLAHIPFVRLRQTLDERYLLEDHSFHELIQVLQSSLGEPQIDIDLRSGTLRCGHKSIDLQPQLLAIYALFAYYRKTEKTRQGRLRYHLINSEDLLALYGEIAGRHSDDYETLAQQLGGGVSKEYFDEKKSRINKELKKQLGFSAGPYLVNSHGRRPNTFSSLDLHPDQIEIISHSKLG